MSGCFLKKVKQVMGFTIAGIALLLINSLPSYAANRDFHMKDGNKTFYASEWGRDEAKFEELLIAIMTESDQLVYEFGDNYYDYNGFYKKMELAPKDKVEEVFMNALKDQSIKVELPIQKEFKVTDIE